MGALCPLLFSHERCPQLDAEKQRRLRNLMARAFVSAGVSMNAASNEDMRYFLSELGPGFDVPSRSTLTSVADEVAVKVRERVEAQLRQAMHVSLTTDGATTIAGDSVQALTAHWINDNWELVSIVLAVYRLSEKNHTAENLASAVVQQLEQWSFRNAISMTTGIVRTASCVAALCAHVVRRWCEERAEDERESEGRQRHPGSVAVLVSHHQPLVRCLLTVGLSRSFTAIRRRVTEALLQPDGDKPKSQLKEIPLLQAIKKIVATVSHSTLLRARLLELQQAAAAADDLRDRDGGDDGEQEEAQSRPLNLVKYVITRWSSAFYMMERALKLRPHLDHLARESVVLGLTPDEWTSVAQLLRILRPFAKATKELEGDSYPTMPKVWRYLVLLKRLCMHPSIDGFNEDVRTVRDRLLAAMDETAPDADIKVDDLLRSAAIADPSEKVR